MHACVCQLLEKSTALSSVWFLNIYQPVNLTPYVEEEEEDENDVPKFLGLDDCLEEAGDEIDLVEDLVDTKTPKAPRKVGAAVQARPRLESESPPRFQRFDCEKVYI